MSFENTTKMTQITRSLTEKEINDIVSFIPPFLLTQSKHCFVETTLSLARIHQEKLRRQLNKVHVDPRIIPELKKQIIRNFEKSLIQPGESVGIIAAQSIGEKQTQTNLNHFHKSGSSDFEGSLATKFSELINASKDIKNHSCTIFFKKEYYPEDHNIETIRKIIGSSLIELKMKNVLENVSFVILKECENGEVEETHKKEIWYDAFNLIYSLPDEDYSEEENGKLRIRTCITLKFDKEKIYNSTLDLKSIAETIETDGKCIFSPESECQIDVYVDSGDLEQIEDTLIPSLESLLISGISSIKQFFYNREEHGKEWYIETDGSNFKKILSLPYVDKYRTTSNYVWDIYDVFGIEAARYFLIEKLIGSMKGINSCHAILLVDKMCFTGTIQGITRYSMRKDEIGPLAKASFEQVFDNFIAAGFYGDKDNMKSVSAGIIVGNPLGIGTGLCSLRYNSNIVKDKVEEVEKW